MLYRDNKFSPYCFSLMLLGTAVFSTVMPSLVLAHGEISVHSLANVKVPATPGLLDGPSPIVVDKQSAIQLGKALFWDSHVGSDGTACGTCHFHAGADRRTRNQVDTGILHTADAISSKAFNINSAGDGAPDYELKASDFPLFRFSDPADKFSTVLFSTDDIVASAGVFSRQYESAGTTEDGHDECSTKSDDIFHIGALNSRQATKRNTPTVINAAFNFRNFWDGRANHIFNGQTPFGVRDPGAWIWVAKNPKAAAKKKRLLLTNAALASQAVGPPMDIREMSCDGRTFPELGRKLLPRRPLESQQVHAEDSVLAAVRHPSGYGLDTSYEALIQKAFAKQYWFGKGNFGSSKSGYAYTQLEANFAFFFGLAIQLYEDTLISDQAPIDQPVDDEGDGFPADFTPEQKGGFRVFQDAHCANCHSGPTLSAAVNPAIYGLSEKKGDYLALVDRNGITEQSDQFGVDLTLVDTGFADTSVVPNEYDVGLGGKDPFGNPLSYSEQYLASLAQPSKSMSDPVKIASCRMTSAFVADFLSNELMNDSKSSKLCKGNKTWAKVPKPAVVKAELAKPNSRLSTVTKGAFKIPTLRNIELTGPYMHNGSMKSLEEVVEFYNRGGNVSNRYHAATLVFPQGFNQQQLSDLVAFLKTLTDERVRWSKAPFDHPELNVAHGHEEGTNALSPDLAKDTILHIPAVGKNGLTPEQGPLRPFDTYLQP